MSKASQIIGQMIFYGVFIAVVGYFSNSPTYTLIEPKTALIIVSLAHTSEPKGKCVKQTPEELAKLPPQLRLPVVCPRERSPIVLELEMDGAQVHSETIVPSGIHRDAAGYTYQKIKVPSGKHHIRVKMRDNIETDGFNHVAERHVDLAPTEILVVDFDSKHREFIFE